MTPPTRTDTNKAAVIGLLREAQRAHIARSNAIENTVIASRYLDNDISPSVAYQQFRNLGYSEHDISEFARSVYKGE